MTLYTKSPYEESRECWKVFLVRKDFYAEKYNYLDSYSNSTIFNIDYA